jgi:drug/metabolite transporter (DMT)-like permease
VTVRGNDLARLARPFSQSSRVGALLMIASATAWAMGTIASKAVLNRYHPSAIALLVTQLAASVVLLVLVARLRGHRMRPAWRRGWTGLLEPGLAYLLGLAGLAITSAANAMCWGPSSLS